MTVKIAHTADVQRFFEEASGLLNAQGNPRLKALVNRIVNDVARVISHEETGNLWTYGRDRRVADWARGAGVEWRELPQQGVIRRLAQATIISESPVNSSAPPTITRMRPSENAIPARRRTTPHGNSPAPVRTTMFISGSKACKASTQVKPECPPSFRSTTA